jgi:hypothetical protein
MAFAAAMAFFDDKSDQERLGYEAAVAWSEAHSRAEKKHVAVISDNTPLTPEQKRSLRKTLAETLDHQALEGNAGDLEIRDIEDKHPYLLVKYPLMTRSLSYLIMNRSWAAVKWNQTGFERVVFTSFGEDSDVGNTWVYKLRNETSSRQRKNPTG